MILLIISRTSLKKNKEKSIQLKLMLWDYLIYYLEIPGLRSVRGILLTTPILIGILVHTMDVLHIKL